MNLTADEIAALTLVRNGADVYGYKTAKMLRKIEREHPDLIDITKPKMYQGDGTDRVPYFGAICTAAGLDALDNAKGQ